MPVSQGISLLHEFKLGNPNVGNPGSNILSVTSTATGDFDKVNLTTDDISRVWRSSSVLTQQEIVIKADVNTEMDTFAILNTNFTEDAIVYIEGGYNQANWQAPPFRNRLIVDEDSDPCHLVFASEGFGAAYPFFRVTVLDPTNTDGYIEIGRIVGGSAFTFENNEDMTDNYQVSNKDQSEKMKTEGYFRPSNENVIVRALRASFQSIETAVGVNANYTGYRRFYRNVKTTKPFLVIVNRANPNVFSAWVQLNTLPTDSFQVNQRVNFSLDAEEVF